MKHYFDGLNLELIKSLNRTGIALWWNAFIDILVHTSQCELVLSTFSKHASQCFNLCYFDLASDEEKLNDNLLSYYAQLLSIIPKPQLVNLFENNSEVRFHELLQELTKVLVNKHPDLVERYFDFDFEGSVQRALCRALTGNTGFTAALAVSTDQEKRFLLAYGFENQKTPMVF